MCRDVSENRSGTIKIKIMIGTIFSFLFLVAVLGYWLNNPWYFRNGMKNNADYEQQNLES